MPGSACTPKHGLTSSRRSSSSVWFPAAFWGPLAWHTQLAHDAAVTPRWLCTLLHDIGITVQMGMLVVLVVCQIIDIKQATEGALVFRELSLKGFNCCNASSMPCSLMCECQPSFTALMSAHLVWV